MGLPCYPRIVDVPGPVDLGVIITPAVTIPRLVEECGLAGIEGVIILSRVDRQKGWEKGLCQKAKKYGLRIIGPNSLGVIRPSIGLYATYLKDVPATGSIAFLSRSEGFSRALLDWAIDRHIGFSFFASIGSMVDVGFAELIDYLAYDYPTKSLVLYMEDGVGEARKFISASRTFAREKPLVVLRTGETGQTTENTRTHASSMVGREEIYEAVFKRIGALKVQEATDLFNVAGILSAKRLPQGNRLLIVTNTRGIGSMAANALLSLGGELATLSEAVSRQVQEIVPARRRSLNPINIGEEAQRETYGRVIAAVLSDTDVDGLLVIFTPQGCVTAEDFAWVVRDAFMKTAKPLLVTMVGGKEVKGGRDILRDANIPVYDTAEEAVRVYCFLYRYKRNLELLYETPKELKVEGARAKGDFAHSFRCLLKDGIGRLNEEQAHRFLRACRIPTVDCYLTRDGKEAVAITREFLGYPVVLKVSSPYILSRPDVGGIVTNINSEAELEEEYERLLQRVRKNMPEVRIEGIIIQRMLEMIDYELYLGAKKDKELGMAIIFGMGGVMVEILRDFSVGLPPLNQTLARRLMEETKVFKMLLHGYRGKAPADLSQLEEILVNFSQMLVDFPEIQEIDINPLAVVDGKTCALDARIIIHEGDYCPHLVIPPYPFCYVSSWSLPDGTEVKLRPVRAEDEPLVHEMMVTLSPETMRSRFYQTFMDMTHEMHVKTCNIDYDREVTMVAEIKKGEKKGIIGIGSLLIDLFGKSAEYALLVHDDYQGKGLGFRMTDLFIGIARDRNIGEIYAYIQRNNYRMYRILKKLGFREESLESLEDLLQLRLFLK